MTEILSFGAMTVLQVTAAVGLLRNGLPGLAAASLCYAAANMAYLCIAWSNIKKPQQ